MSEEPPGSVVQATGKVAERIVNGFSNSPGLLLIVLLNVGLIGMAGYALIAIARMSSEGRTQIMSVLEACIAGQDDRRVP